MERVLLIALGGAIGTVLRYLASIVSAKCSPSMPRIARVSRYADQYRARAGMIQRIPRRGRRRLQHNAG